MAILDTWRHIWGNMRQTRIAYGNSQLSFKCAKQMVPNGLHYLERHVTFTEYDMSHPLDRVISGEVNSANLIP